MTTETEKLTKKQEYNQKATQYYIEGYIELAKYFWDKAAKEEKDKKEDK